MMRRGIGLLIILVFVLSACSLVGQSEDACDAGGSLFFDDFSGEQDCGWREYNQSGTVVGINQDTAVMEMSTSQPGQIWWTNPGRVFDNSIITAKATQVGGPDNNAYGLICRYQDENNYYVFLVSGDGYYAIGKYQTGSDQIVYLTENEEYIFSDAIQQGASLNDIRATCIGDELSLQVNGIPLVTVTDPTFVRGDVGLAVSTLEPGTAVVQFDDFRVLQP